MMELVVRVEESCVIIFDLLAKEGLGGGVCKVLIEFIFVATKIEFLEFCTCTSET